MYIWTHGPRIINTFPSLDVLVSRCVGVLASGVQVSRRAGVLASGCAGVRVSGHPGVLWMDVTELHVQNSRRGHPAPPSPGPPLALGSFHVRSGWGWMGDGSCIFCFFP